MKRTATWTLADLTGHWRSFERSDLIKRDQCNFDITWLKEDDPSRVSTGASLNEITIEIMHDLETAIAQFSGSTLGREGPAN